MNTQTLAELNGQIKQLQAEKARIEMSNALFNSMTPSQRRVAIAKDVILQIKASRYKTGHTGYIEDFKPQNGVSIHDAPLQKTICNMESCRVCARGAMVLSAIKKFNNYNDPRLITEEHYDTYTLRAAESLYFSENQAVLIESAYERRSLNPTKACDAAVRYGKSLSGRKSERLIQIMRNIIRNHGKFVVPQKYYV